MGITTLKCPSCGADVEISDTLEFGFCNYCGTKIMQEKLVVEHKGSVKIDNDEYVKKFLQNARRALTKEDWEEVEKYYNLVEQNDPDCIEAVFFSSYGKAMLALFDSDYYKREQKFKVLVNSISVISDCYETTTEDKEEIIGKIYKYVKKIQHSEFVHNAAADGAGSRKWCIKLNSSVEKAFLNELSEISQTHDDPVVKEILDSEKERRDAELEKKQKIADDREKHDNKTRMIVYTVVGIIIILGVIGFIISSVSSGFNSDAIPVLALAVGIIGYFIFDTMKKKKGK